MAGGLLSSSGSRTGGMEGEGRTGWGAGAPKVPPETEGRGHRWRAAAACGQFKPPANEAQPRARPSGEAAPPAQVQPWLWAAPTCLGDVGLTEFRCAWLSRIEPARTLRPTLTWPGGLCGRINTRLAGVALSPSEPQLYTLRPSFLHPSPPPLRLASAVLAGTGAYGWARDTSTGGWGGRKGGASGQPFAGLGARPPWRLLGARTPACEAGLGRHSALTSPGAVCGALLAPAPYFINEEPGPEGRELLKVTEQEGSAAQATLRAPRTWQAGPAQRAEGGRRVQQLLPSPSPVVVVGGLGSSSADPRLASPGSSTAGLEAVWPG